MRLLLRRWLVSWTSLPVWSLVTPAPPMPLILLIVRLVVIRCGSVLMLAWTGWR